MALERMPVWFLYSVNVPIHEVLPGAHQIVKSTIILIIVRTFEDATVVVLRAERYVTGVVAVCAKRRSITLWTW